MTNLNDSMVNTSLSRRSFLAVSGSASGGLLLSLMMPTLVVSAQDAQAEGTESFTTGAYIEIASDNKITITIGQSEMGQGALTGMCQIIAEELDADWANIIVKKGAVHPAFFRPNAPIQVTGGSGSIRSFYGLLRKTGAAARHVMIKAAASHWDLPADKLTTEPGNVINAKEERVSYGQLVTLAAKVTPPDIETVPLKSTKDFRLIGMPVKRLDIPPKTTGEATFGLDIQLPEMLSAVIVKPPEFGAKLIDFDAQEALTFAGVKDIFEISGGVAIVADDYWHAMKARENVIVNWGEGKVAFKNDEDMKLGFSDAIKNPSLTALKRGENAEATEENLIEAEFFAPFLAQACMEPMNCTVHVLEDRSTVWTGTQFQTAVQNTVAGLTGQDPTKVAVETQYLGGGFGRRSVQDFVHFATEIAMRFDVPVKTIFSREDDMRGGYYRPAALCQMKATVDVSGNISGFDAKIATPSLAEHTGMKFLWQKGGIDSSAVEGLSERSFPYALENIQVDWIKHDPGIPIWFWRSVGASQNFYFLECFIDLIAKKSKKDPYALRMSLLADKPRHRHVLQLAAEKAAWGDELPEGRARGIAIAESFGSVCAQVVEVSLVDGEPVVERVVCVIDAGRVINPALVERQMHSSILYALSAVYEDEITFEDSQVQQSNFWDYEVLRMDRAPKMEVTIIASDAAPGGVGEPGTPPLAPAVCNALLSLTGKPVLSLPLSRHSFIAI